MKKRRLKKWVRNLITYSIVYIIIFVMLTISIFGYINAIN
jgi:hypothetical protein